VTRANAARRKLQILNPKFETIPNDQKHKFQTSGGLFTAEALRARREKKIDNLCELCVSVVKIS